MANPNSNQVKNKSTVPGTTVTAAINYLQANMGGGGGGDMYKAVYDTNNNGKVDNAEVADSVPYSGVTGKPSTFPPSAHTHAIADVTSLQTSLNDKQDTLVSGTNIKTINGTSVLGSGDITIAAGGDMLKSVYDTNNNGKVDNAQVSDSLATLSGIPQGGATTNQVLAWAGSAWTPTTLTAGTGDVVGPASSTDGGIALFSGTTGKLLKATGNATVTGNLDFSGTARRITGDFSNATIANRVVFQSNVTNGNSIIRIIPNGTATIAAFQAGNSNDLSNQSTLSMTVTSSQASLNSDMNGSGTTLPLSLATAGVNRLSITAAGNISVDNGGTFGYGVGSGGTVTQVTSKSTAVTLNKPSGVITLTADSMATNALITFTLNNSTISANDVIAISVGGFVGPYRATVGNVVNGACNITVQNNSASTLSEAIKINFVVMKVSTS